VRRGDRGVLEFDVKSGASFNGLRDEEEDEEGKGDDDGIGNGRLWSINPSGSRLGILGGEGMGRGMGKRAVARISNQEMGMYIVVF
jgi:hypothetical protein